MPEVAANAAEAVLQGWAVEVNTAYAAGDVIAVIETDKAVVDVAAEADGVLLRTLAAEGATVPVGAAIAILGEVGERPRPDDLDALLTGTPPPSATAAPLAAAAPVGRVFASPLARRLAKEASLPLEEITGTGPNGRIVRRDVELAIEHRTAHRQPHPAEAAPGKPQPAAYTEVPHSRVRRAIATRLTESKQTIPHFSVRGTAHVGKLLKLRRRLNDDTGQKITLNDLVIKAAAHAHRLVPAMNVIWTPEATWTFDQVDLSVAVATDGGLVTPVVRAADEKSLTTIAATVAALAERARSGRLRQEELEGGVMTVTNLGMYDVEEFAAIINPPQSAILAVGAVRQEPVVRNGTLKPGHVMRVTLSADHRPIDGTVAAAWMRTFLDLLANPVLILK
ncbi:dihydrolipoamide acetyltransferase family protein [Nonomuraea polychroma]|uniref:dihydrolipoamide acetyltransferase family protein n=1 Tax=Nonomuraea polychroma TaxID=46176 RepID=UPI003D8B2636